MRYLLVDRIDELVAGVSAKARKNVAMTEDYLEWHFHGQPVVPGTLVLEAFAQLAGWLEANVTGVEGASMRPVLQFKGGQSNPTYLVGLTTRDGADVELVLRTTPTVLRGPLRVRALVWVRCPRTGSPRRWRIPR
jgi:hypothetical protein